MSILLMFLQKLPLWIYLISGAVFLAAAGIVIRQLVIHISFRKILEQISADTDKTDELILNRFSDKQILNRSSLIEKTSGRTDANLPVLIGLDDLWITRLISFGRKVDLKRILAFSPDKGLFNCFLLCLEKPEYRELLFNWIENSDNFLVMKRIAVSGKGEQFNGNTALEMFSGRIDEIREMIGDPEWTSRYFTIKILLYDNDERSERAVWDSFNDSHALVRKTVAAEIKTEDRERLYKELMNLVLNDPVLEVRTAARIRIKTDMPDLYSFDYSTLTPKKENILHLLEQLQYGSKEDENAAMKFLNGDDLELRLIAAEFLTETNTLKRLFLETDTGDMEGLERNYNLLYKSCEVNISSFLKEIEYTDNQGSLLIASRILLKEGNRELITALCRKVFLLSEFQKGDPDNKALYEGTIKCVCIRGTDKALSILNEEVEKRKYILEFQKFVLPLIPQRADYIFLNTFISFLKDPLYTEDAVLGKAFLKLPVSLILPELLNIVKNDKDEYTHSVRIKTLGILSRLELPYCIQTILENLPALPLNEAVEFTKLLSVYTGSIFDERVKNLLEGGDAQIRAHLLLCLPLEEKKKFLGIIKKSLNDSDQLVRIASVRALIDFKDVRLLNQAFSLLRDPVENVRKKAAEVFGTFGSDPALEKLKEVIDDKNEVKVVKQAALSGLGASSKMKSIDLLALKLTEDNELQDEIICALAKKTDKKEITHIVELFKDADPLLREKLALSIKKMRSKGEESILKILTEDIHSLKPYFTEILEATGYIEKRIRELNHRNPVVRRNSADFLTLTGSKAAFRGLVRAARDPDNEVRVKVVKALEFLNTDKGSVILNELMNDPDKRVRTYTLWALERIKAKSLID